MASFDHELLVELFRHDGGVAVELLRACAGIAVVHAGLELGTVDLSQAVPIEVRASRRPCHAREPHAAAAVTRLSGIRPNASMS